MWHLCVVVPHPLKEKTKNKLVLSLCFKFELSLLSENGLNCLWCVVLILAVQQDISIPLAGLHEDVFTDLAVKALPVVLGYPELVVTLYGSHLSPMHIPGVLPHPGFHVLFLSWSCATDRCW